MVKIFKVKFMNEKEAAHQQNLQQIAELSLAQWKLPDQTVTPYVFRFLSKNPAVVEQLSSQSGKSAEEILHFFGG